MCLNHPSPRLLTRMMTTTPVVGITTDTMSLLPSHVPLCASPGAQQPSSSAQELSLTRQPQVYYENSLVSRSQRRQQIFWLLEAQKYQRNYSVMVNSMNSLGLQPVLENANADWVGAGKRFAWNLYCCFTRLNFNRCVHPSLVTIVFVTFHAHRLGR